MAQVIHPPHDLSTLPSRSLSPAEEVALKLFRDSLDDQWEIYIHPHLNGTSPDFVLLNPRTGIGVFEVRDWNDTSLLHTDDNDIKLALGKLRSAKNEIFDLYCPALGMHSRSVQRAKSVIHCVLFCPNASDNYLSDAIGPYLSEKEQKYKAIKLLGMERIANGNLYTACPEFRYMGLMTAEAAAALRPWIDGTGLTTENAPRPLNQIQKNIAQSRTKSGYRRIRGAAGSGKTMILAARAAQLARTNKRVLVVPFNIMLVSLLRHLIFCELRDEKRINFITCLHFHEWCRRICVTYDDAEYRAIFADKHTSRQDKLNECVPELTRKLIRQNKAREQIYDAILVDEGQDLRLEWWNILREVCKPDGEMVLAADRQQDVYGNANTWTEEAMRGAGFRGPWIDLSVSYRLPGKLVTVAQHFAKAFLPSHDGDIPVAPVQGSLMNSVLQWLQCTANDAAFFCRTAILDMIMNCSSDGGIKQSDITLLSQRRETGRQVVQRLRSLGLNGEDTFTDDNEEAKRAKRRFGEKKYSFKASTIHGFKGWETTRIVLYLQGLNRPEDKALAYVGLTRLLQHTSKTSYFTVVCSAPELKGFGKREFGKEFRDAYTDMGTFIEGFLATQFFAFRKALPSLYGVTLCTLKRFAFQDCFPDYHNPLHRNFYFLKYSVAYIIEYRAMYRRILASGWLRNSPSPVVLSIGCGAMLDLVGLTYELRERDGWADPAYYGVDLVDWHCDDTRLVPNQNLIRNDIGKFSEVKNKLPPIDIIFFPKSISEIPEISLDAFVDNLNPAALADKTIVAVSKRGRATTDHDAGLRLCRNLCEKLGFTIARMDNTVFSESTSPQKFTQLLPCAESRERVEYYLDRVSEEMERLYNRFLDCDCPNVTQCMKITGRQPMRNLNTRPGLNAEPEIYYLQKKNIS